MSETMTLQLIDVYEWHCCESVPPDPKTEIHGHMALAVARAVRELVELKCERDALRAEVERLRNEERVERCESGDPACGPVEFHDSEGVPLCKACWDALVAENASQAQPPAERGEG